MEIPKVQVKKNLELRVFLSFGLLIDYKAEGKDWVKLLIPIGVKISKIKN